MTGFSLATVAQPSGDEAALVVDQAFYSLARLGLPNSGLRSLMDDWDALLKFASTRCVAIASGQHAETRIAKPQLLAPLRFPNKLVCVGAVYRDHLEQFGLPPERWPRMPIFLRPPTTSIVGPGRTVIIPPTTRQFDWEIELAVVIGKPLSCGSEREAGGAIAGYSVGIDFTCRDLLDRDGPAGVDLIRAKAQNGMGPMGPWVTPAQFVGDPQALSLKLWVNDVLRQDGTTDNMLFSVYEQVATISQFIALEPGDVVFTGSPAGSARSDDQFLKGGDRIVAAIEKVGTLELELIGSVERAREEAHA